MTDKWSQTIQFFLPQGEPRGVLQETYRILLVCNAVRYLMHEDALSVDLDPWREPIPKPPRVRAWCIPDEGIH